MSTIHKNTHTYIYISRVKNRHSSGDIKKEKKKSIHIYKFSHSPQIVEEDQVAKEEVAFGTFVEFKFHIAEMSYSKGVLVAVFVGFM